MAKFTDIFIRRPVLATVISLLIFIIGLRAIFDLQVRQFPKLENTVIKVTTAYPGAVASLVEGFITSPLEKEVAGAEGIDYMTSTSQNGVSTIQAYIKLNFDSNAAFTNVLSKVQEAKSYLPQEAEASVVEKQTGSMIALMYISFSSPDLSAAQVTNYVTRVVQPKLQTLPGVGQVQVFGGSKFAMRIWLNSQRMAGFGVSADDVANALANNNYQGPSGGTKGVYIEIPINPGTDLHSADTFSNIVIKRDSNGDLVRLKDVARVELGSEDYNSSVYFNGEKAVFIGIISTPTANPLSVIANVKKVMPDIQLNYPPSLQSKIVYDATDYIRASIHEVMRTIIEATIIVVLVIYLFLGSLRTVTIPIVTIPLSLVGVCVLILMLNYSINLLTLLAMVLAIGMVVDDAIVVVENIYRHIEQGMSPLDAAIQGAREIAMPIISMTITLAAVYAPIGFMGGVTGSLFKEFAFTLASTIIISGIIALTLSPMMCSKVLSAEISKQSFVHFVDRQFEKIKIFYRRLLMGTLNAQFVTIFFAFVVLVSCAFLYLGSQQELAPDEDQGVLFAIAQGPQTAGLHYMETYTNLYNSIYKKMPAIDDSFIINGSDSTSSGMLGAILKPWNQRKEKIAQVQQELQAQFDQIAGLQVQSFGLPALPTSGNPIPIQFIVNSIEPFSVIYPIMSQLVQDANQSGLFLFIQGDLRFDQPQVNLDIDRDKAAQLGINMKNIGDTIATTFSGAYVNRFGAEGQSYRVIPQLEQDFRLNPIDITRVYVNTIDNNLIPLSTIAQLRYTILPNTLSHFQQLNAATLQGVMAPGHSMAEGLDFLKNDAKKIFPSDVTYDYAGQSRQFVQEGQALIYTFFFSIIVIYLVLAAQFESFRDPLVIMISVPMAICGALLPINWGLASINIFTQVGLITLIGLISKHGILMVEFANQLRHEQGLTHRQAIEQAAVIRLRPVLMTTFAMILGVFPLLLASGAGAVSRFDMGLVIASGMFIGTLFTLFVIPTMYSLKVKQIIYFLLAD